MKKQKILFLEKKNKNKLKKKKNLRNAFKFYYLKKLNNLYTLILNY